jgi:hypothetical protein
MNVDLFLKNVPAVVKDLIGREAFENRRSVNQEAIALLEEALLLRVGSHSARARTSLEALRPPILAAADKASLESSRRQHAVVEPQKGQ